MVYLYTLEIVALSTCLHDIYKACLAGLVFWESLKIFPEGSCWLNVIRGGVILILLENVFICFGLSLPSPLLVYLLDLSYVGGFERPKPGYTPT